MQESFKCLLEQYHFLDGHIVKQTKLLCELYKTELYTRVGKSSLRATLVQASWALIRKDGVMQEKYDRLKSRSGGKRAIVAVARTLLIRMRRMLLDNEPYVIGLIAAN